MIAKAPRTSATSTASCLRDRRKKPRLLLCAGSLSRCNIALSSALAGPVNSVGRIALEPLDRPIELAPEPDFIELRVHPARYGVNEPRQREGADCSGRPKDKGRHVFRSLPPHYSLVINRSVPRVRELRATKSGRRPSLAPLRGRFRAPVA